MKRRLILYALILQGIAVLLLFMPCMYNHQYWEKDAGTIGTFTLIYAGPVSFLAGNFNFTRSPLSYITLIVMLLAIAVMVLAVMDKGGPLTQYGLYASPLALVLFVGTVITRTGTELLEGGTVASSPDCQGKWKLEIGYLFYVVLLLQIAAAVLSVLVALNKVKDKTGQAA